MPYNSQIANDFFANIGKTSPQSSSSDNIASDFFSNIQPSTKQSVPQPTQTVSPSIYKKIEEQLIAKKNTIFEKLSSGFQTKLIEPIQKKLQQAELAKINVQRETKQNVIKPIQNVVQAYALGKIQSDREINNPQYKAEIKKLSTLRQEQIKSELESGRYPKVLAKISKDQELQRAPIFTEPKNIFEKTLNRIMLISPELDLTLTNALATGDVNMFTLPKPITGVSKKTIANARKVLGVKPNATPEQIKQTYINLAKTAHPDVGGSTEKMAEINKAFETLTSVKPESNISFNGLKQWAKDLWTKKPKAGTSDLEIIKPGIYSPQEIQKIVTTSNLANTTDGNKLIKTSLEAQRQQKMISIEKEAVINKAQTVRGSEIVEPSLRTSNKEPSLPVAGLNEPLGSKTLTSNAPTLEKSTNQTLSSKRMNFLSKFSMNIPSNKDYNIYYKEVKGVEPEFKSVLEKMATDSNEGYSFRLKKLDSLVRKITTKNKSLGEMNDTLAGTIVTNDIDGAVMKAKNNGIKITTDYRKKPTFLGYKGVHGDMELSNGVKTEVQFQTKESYYQKEYAHTIYEKWREYIENNGDSTFEDVFSKVPENQQLDFQKDIQLSNDIYNGKVKIPQKYIDHVNTRIVYPKSVKSKNVAQAPVSDIKAGIKTVKPKVVEVSREKLPIGKGEKQVSTLESRVKKTLDNISQEQIDKLGLTTYKQMNNKDTIKLASEYVINNPDDALKVLTGEINPPKGLNTNSIYVAMVNNSVGNVELATKLATMSSTAMGQNIEILKELDKDSPVKLMNEVVKFREKQFAQRYKNRTLKQVKTKVVKDIKAKIKTPSKYDWNTFINSIEC